MLRNEAVKTLLVEEIACIREPASEPTRRREQVERARNRAALTAAIDWLAIALLFFWRDPLSEFLFLGASEEAVFTLAILAVAVHSGFRLGQWEKYRCVEASLNGFADGSGG